MNAFIFTGVLSLYMFLIVVGICETNILAVCGWICTISWFLVAMTLKNRLEQ